MGLRKITYRLLEPTPVRDSGVHFTEWALPLDRARYWGLEVANSTDQPVNITLIGGSSPIPSAMGEVSPSRTVAAGTVEPVATNIWAPYLALRFQFPTAPTSGSIEIRGWVQEEG